MHGQDAQDLGQQTVSIRSTYRAGLESVQCVCRMFSTCQKPVSMFNIIPGKSRKELTVRACPMEGFFARSAKLTMSAKVLSREDEPPAAPRDEVLTLCRGPSAQ